MPGVGPAPPLLGPCSGAQEPQLLHPEAPEPVFRTEKPLPHGWRAAPARCS